MKILVINGPNLNMLGIREPDIYGRQTYNDLVEMIKKYCGENDIEAEFFQSNHEGAIIDRIQEAYQKIDGIVINPAAYTHTSVAIRDAISAVSLPAVEIHISNIHNREDFRKNSFIAPVCIGQISGFGLDSYKLGLQALINKLR